VCVTSTDDDDPLGLAEFCLRDQLRWRISFVRLINYSADGASKPIGKLLISALDSDIHKDP
jgi:hypothetical protein